MSAKTRKWDDIYNNLDALTPEDREEIARRVDSEDKSNDKSVKLLADQQKLETDVTDLKTGRSICLSPATTLLAFNLNHNI